VIFCKIHLKNVGSAPSGPELADDYLSAPQFHEGSKSYPEGRYEVNQKNNMVSKIYFEQGGGRLSGHARPPPLYKWGGFEKTSPPAK